MADAQDKEGRVAVWVVLAVHGLPGLRGGQVRCLLFPGEKIVGSRKAEPLCED